MIDQPTLITYLAILFGFVFIPGPAVVLTVVRATSSGTRAGLATGLGIAIGDLIHTAMAVLGLSAVILTSAFLFSLIKYLGAAYLVYLGIRAIMAKVSDAPLADAAKISTYEALRQAILAEVLNPKSAVFFLAFLPQFVKPENGAVAVQLMILGMLFVGMGLLSTVVLRSALVEREIFCGEIRWFFVGRAKLSAASTAPWGCAWHCRKSDFQPLCRCR